MQTKLTLRMEEAVIVKAKRLAKREGKSVSALVSEFFSSQEEAEWTQDLPPVTSSMLGVISNTSSAQEAPINEEDYYEYLERKHS